MCHAADVCIVGAGPSGMFAVFALGQLGLSAVLVDALAQPGGQCTALYPEKPIYDIPSRPSVTGDELIADLRAQMEPYEPVFVGGETVAAMDEHAQGFRVRCSGGTTIQSKAVILALGGGAFQPNRPPLPGIQSFEGRSVHYAVRDRAALKGQRIVIAGGGDSALDWALLLADQAKSVALVHRRPSFRAAPASVAALHKAIERDAITLHAPSQLSGLLGEDGVLHSVEVRRLGGDPNCVERIPADVLLAFFGLTTDLGALADWGITAGSEAIPVDPATLETCRPGIFAIGDVAAYPGKLKLILTAFSEAARAAHAIWRRLNPQIAFHFEYSTTRGVPQHHAAAAEGRT